MASRPSRRGRTTSASNRGHHPPKFVHDTKSSISTTGAPRSTAIVRASVDLPAQEGPSTATIRTPGTFESRAGAEIRATAVLLSTVLSVRYWKSAAHGTCPYQAAPSCVSARGSVVLRAVARQPEQSTHAVLQRCCDAHDGGQPCRAVMI